jgi:hypothetical protein
MTPMDIVAGFLMAALMVALVFYINWAVQGRWRTLAAHLRARLDALGGN